MVSEQESLRMGAAGGRVPRVEELRQAGGGQPGCGGLS